MASESGTQNTAAQYATEILKGAAVVAMCLDSEEIVSIEQALAALVNVISMAETLRDSIEAALANAKQGRRK